MEKNTEILKVLSEITYNNIPGFSQVIAICNEDGKERQLTFIIETKRKKCLKKIKPGFKYTGDYWND